MKITNLCTLACVLITIAWVCKKEKVAAVEKLPLNDHDTAFRASCPVIQTIRL